MDKIGRLLNKNSKEEHKIKLKIDILVNLNDWPRKKKVSKKKRSKKSLGRKSEAFALCLLDINNIKFI